MANIKMKTVVDKETLLATVRKNAAKHSLIVAEARDGYVKKARAELEVRLEQLRKGRLVSLTFSLTPPADYTEVYRNCIQMLEWTTEKEIVLEAAEFRQLVLDRWDWTEQFLHTNSRYSAQAMVDMDGLSNARE